MCYACEMRTLLLGGLLVIVGCGAQGTEQPEFELRATHEPLIVNTSNAHYVVPDISERRAFDKLIELARTACEEEAFIYDPARQLLFETGEQSHARTADVGEYRMSERGVRQMVPDLEEYIDVHLHIAWHWREANEQGVVRTTFAQCAFPSHQDLLMWRRSYREGVRQAIACALGVTEVRGVRELTEEQIGEAYEYYACLFDVLMRVGADIVDAFYWMTGDGLDRARGLYHEYRSDVLSAARELGVEEVAVQELYLLDQRLAQLSDATDIRLCFTFYPASDWREEYHRQQRGGKDFLYHLMGE